VWKPREPLDQIPTPTGVPIRPTRIDAFPLGSVLTAFLFSTPNVLRTIARVQPDCAEEKGYTVSVVARSNYSQESVVLVESASIGVNSLTCRCREAVEPS